MSSIRFACRVLSSSVLSVLLMSGAQAEEVKDPATELLKAAAAPTPASIPDQTGTSPNSPTAYTSNADPTSSAGNTAPTVAGVPAQATPAPAADSLANVQGQAPAASSMTQSDQTTMQAELAKAQPANAAPVATTPATEPTPSMTPGASAANQALKQQEGDATSQKNLEQVFKASEKTYSLAKKGSFSASYDLSYSYFRDTQLDLALDNSSSVITRLRVGDEAQHTVTNNFGLQYGLRDNLTLTMDFPLVARMDVNNSRKAVGLGDIGFGARWEPFPTERGRMPLTLFGSVSTKTGDSPYNNNPLEDLSTGKGYYSVGGGASTRKFIDPLVLFTSASMNYGFKETGLNQNRGGRLLNSFEPGFSGGVAVGFAYSLNYDVSLTMSYQQSFSAGSRFDFANGDYSSPSAQTSAMMNLSLGVRVSPKTIVNGSVGFGLTEDAPDVSLGLSFPLNFEGLSFPLNRIKEGVLGK